MRDSSLSEWLIYRDGRIPLFFDIRIFGYLGYQFFLDTWIIGYLDIMDTWIHGYMDTWISVFFGYMDTWILWISIFFIIHILDILSKYPDIFGYFFKLPNMKKRQSVQSFFESVVLQGDLSLFIIFLCISRK